MRNFWKNEYFRQFALQVYYELKSFGLWDTNHGGVYKHRILPIFLNCHKKITKKYFVTVDRPYSKLYYKMKLKTITLLSFSASLLMTACQKDKATEPIHNGAKVKSYKEKVVTSDGDSTIYTFNLSYDGNNRLTGMNQVEIPGNKFVFTYPSDSKYTMEIYEMGTLSIHEDFFLNSKHLVDSTYQYDEDEDVTTEKYLYNGSNQLTTLKEYDNSDLWNVTTYTYDGNGNVSKTTDTNGQVETFDYYPDLVYTMPAINPLSATGATHLVKTHKVTSNGYLVGNSVSTYTFDSNNRISTITQTLDNGTVTTQTFTYF